MWQVFIGPGFPRMANDGRGGALSFVLVFCGNSTSRPLGSSFSSSAGEVGGRRLLCQLLLPLASKKAPRTTIKRAHARVRFPDACSFPRRPPPRGASVVVRLSSLSSAFWDLTISMYVYIYTLCHGGVQDFQKRQEMYVGHFFFNKMNIRCPKITQHLGLMLKLCLFREPILPRL